MSAKVSSFPALFYHRVVLLNNYGFLDIYGKFENTEMHIHIMQ